MVSIIFVHVLGCYGNLKFPCTYNEKIKCTLAFIFSVSEDTLTKILQKYFRSSPPITLRILQNRRFRLVAMATEQLFCLSIKLAVIRICLFFYFGPVNVGPAFSLGVTCPESLNSP